jgi:hypothetical protein
MSWSRGIPSRGFRILQIRAQVSFDYYLLLYVVSLGDILDATDIPGLQVVGKVHILGMAYAPALQGRRHGLAIRLNVGHDGLEKRARVCVLSFSSGVSNENEI